MRSEAGSDLAKSGEVGRIARVVDRVFAASKNVAAVSPMCVPENASSPVARWDMRDGDIAVAIASPPVEFHDVAKTEIRDQIKDMFGHDCGGPGPAALLCMLHDRPQRGAMEVIEMRMGDEHQINGRKISDAQARLSQALKDEEPAREIGVDHGIFPADLQEKAGMADKSNTHLAIGDKHRLVGLARARRDRGVTNQFPELLGSFAQRRILKRVFQHGMSEFLLSELPGVPSFCPSVLAAQG